MAEVEDKCVKCRHYKLLTTLQHTTHPTAYRDVTKWTNLQPGRLHSFPEQIKRPTKELQKTTIKGTRMRSLPCRYISVHHSLYLTVT